jgi:hypothetical protein
MKQSKDQWVFLNAEYERTGKAQQACLPGIGDRCADDELFRHEEVRQKKTGELLATQIAYKDKSTYFHQGAQHSMPDQVITGSIFTLGYSGWKLGDLKHQVEDLDAILVDCRHSPTSRAPQWSKKQMSAFFGERYLHLPQFGNVNYRNGGEIVLADYEAGKAIVVEHLTQGHSLILMCACDNVATCHRLTVADRLEEDLGPEAQAVHLFHR